MTVAPNPATVAVDSTLQLTVVLEDAKGNTLGGRSVTWSSDATSTATADANGLMTGAAAGSANISATSEGKSGTTAVSVTRRTTSPGSPT